jgi:hypothetical protein
MSVPREQRMAKREVPMRDSLKEAVWRLIEAAEVLLENLADAGQNTDVNGNLLPDVKELMASIADLKVRLVR